MIWVALHKFETMMAKLFSIMMSGLILIQSMDIAFDDIAQFDELLEHADFHAEKYGDNLLVFISKHYGELKEQHDKDHKEEKKDHEELPFQKHCACSSFTAMAIITAFPDLPSLQNNECPVANFNYRAPTSSPHTKGLLQPPQFA